MPLRALAVGMATTGMLAACGPDTARTPGSADVHLIRCVVRPEAMLTVTVGVRNLSAHAIKPKVAVSFVDATGAPFDQASVVIAVGPRDSATGTVTSISASSPIDPRGCRLG